MTLVTALGMCAAPAEARDTVADFYVVDTDWSKIIIDDDFQIKEEEEKMESDLEELQGNPTVVTKGKSVIISDCEDYDASLFDLDTVVSLNHLSLTGGRTPSNLIFKSLNWDYGISGTSDMSIYIDKNGIAYGAIGLDLSGLSVDEQRKAIYTFCMDGKNVADLDVKADAGWGIEYIDSYGNYIHMGADTVSKENAKMEARLEKYKTAIRMFNNWTSGMDCSVGVTIPGAYSTGFYVEDTKNPDDFRSGTLQYGSTAISTGIPAFSLGPFSLAITAKYECAVKTICDNIKWDGRLYTIYDDTMSDAVDVGVRGGSNFIADLRTYNDGRIVTYRTGNGDLNNASAKVTFEDSLILECQVFGGLYTYSKNLSIANTTIYDSSQENALTNAAEELTAAMAAEDGTVQLQPADLSYLDVEESETNDNWKELAEGAFSNDIESSLVKENSLQNSTVEYAVLDDGTEIAAWTDSADSDMNHVSVYYAVRPSGGEWTEPMQIEDDNCMDILTDIVTDGTKAWVTWYGANRSFDEEELDLDEDTELVDLVNSMDVSVAAIDTNGTVSDYHMFRFTDGLDGAPTVTFGDGKTYLVWTNAHGVTPDEIEGTERDIYLAVCEDGVWSEPQLLYDINEQVGVVTASYNDGLKVAYTVTDEDGTFVYENGVRVTEGTSDELTPIYYGGTLYWFCDGQLCTRDAAYASDEDFGYVSNCKLVDIGDELPAILYTKAYTDKECDLMISVYDEREGSYADGKPLIYNDEEIVDYDVIVRSSGVFSVLANINDLDEDGDVLKGYIVEVSYHNCSDVDVIDVTTYDEIFDGETAQANVTLYNDSFASAKNFRLLIKDLDGNILYEEEIPFLKAGGAMVVKTEFKTGFYQAARGLQAVIEYAEDTDLSDNIMDFEVLYYETPKAMTGLAYTGETQELVTAGKSDRGVFVYSLTEDGDYLESIPTAVESGTYQVYYRLVEEDGSRILRTFDIPLTVTVSSDTAAGDFGKIPVLWLALLGALVVSGGVFAFIRRFGNRGFRMKK